MRDELGVLGVDQLPGCADVGAGWGQLPGCAGVGTRVRIHGCGYTGVPVWVHGHAT